MILHIQLNDPYPSEYTKSPYAKGAPQTRAPPFVKPDGEEVILFGFRFMVVSPGPLFQDPGPILRGPLEVVLDKLFGGIGGESFGYGMSFSIRCYRTILFPESYGKVTLK